MTFFVPCDWLYNDCQPVGCVRVRCAFQVAWRERGGRAGRGWPRGVPRGGAPSDVLGGRAMEIVYNDAALQKYLVTAVEVDPERPVLVDKYLLVSGTD